MEGSPRLNLLLTMVATFIICLAGCGAQQGETQQGEAAKEVEQAAQAGQDTLSTKADIVSSGTINQHFETSTYEITFETWDMAHVYRGMLPEEDGICIKAHVKNKTDETYTINQLIPMTFYLNDVEIISSSYDFYGDERTDRGAPHKRYKAGADSDCYYIINCDLNGEHKVDIELYDTGTSTLPSSNSKSLKEISFSCE